MKNILFQKIPINEDGSIIISVEQISKIHNSIKNSLPDDYILVTSPMDLQKIDGDTKIINIDCKSYSYNEIMAIIEGKV